MWFPYLNKFLIIIVGQSTLFPPKFQDFVRADLIAIGNKNLFPEFKKIER